MKYWAVIACIFVSSGCAATSSIGLDDRKTDISSSNVRNGLVGLDRTSVQRDGEAAEALVGFLEAAQRARAVDECIRTRFADIERVAAQEKRVCAYETYVDRGWRISPKTKSRKAGSYTINLPSGTGRLSIDAVLRENQDVFADMFDRGLKASDVACTARLIRISDLAAEAQYQENQFDIFTGLGNALMVITESSARSTGLFNALTSAFGLTVDNYQQFQFLTPDHDQLKRLIGESQAATLRQIQDYTLGQFAQKYDDTLEERGKTSNSVTGSRESTDISVLAGMYSPFKTTTEQKTLPAPLNYYNTLMFVVEYDYQCTLPRIQFFLDEGLAGQYVKYDDTTGSISLKSFSDFSAQTTEDADAPVANPEPAPAQDPPP